MIFLVNSNKQLLVEVKMADESGVRGCECI